jgi:hypothetical protein
MGTGRSPDEPDGLASGMDPTGGAARDEGEEIRRWLAGRLVDEPPPAEAGPDETPTSPGLRRNPLLASAPRWTQRAGGRGGVGEEDEDDPATEVVRGLDEDDLDPRTVRMSRAQLVNESVTDEQTVRAEGWSLPEGPVDEVPLSRSQEAAVNARPSRQRPFRPPSPPAPPPVSISVSSRSGLAPTPVPVVREEGVGGYHVLAAIGVGLAIGLVGAAIVLWLAV